MAGPEPRGGGYGDPGIWALQPGDVIERTTLQERYGGRRQGGIGPSRTSPNVLIFAEPAAGEPLGQFDGWRADGCFHYTGEGRRGDQQMKSGNAAILTHVADGRALRLFLGGRGRVVYEGEFALAADGPFYTTDAAEAKNGPVRSVIVFRLRPADVHPRPSDSRLDLVCARAAASAGVLADGAALAEVPVDEQWTERAFVAPSAEPDEAQRREQKLLQAFAERLLREGHEITRLEIVPAGEAKPLFCDLCDRTTNTLFEAKGTVERGAIRMAIGQLLDYGRFVLPAPRLAVLLPQRPRRDLLDLLAHAGVGLVWPEGRRFAELPREHD